MTISVTLADMLVGIGIFLPLFCTAVYVSVRIAIKQAVSDVLLAVERDYRQKRVCDRIREECPALRRQMAEIERAGGI